MPVTATVVKPGHSGGGATVVEVVEGSVVVEVVEGSCVVEVVEGWNVEYSVDIGEVDSKGTVDSDEVFESTFSCFAVAKISWPPIHTPNAMFPVTWTTSPATDADSTWKKFLSKKYCLFVYIP